MSGAQESPASANRWRFQFFARTVSSERSIVMTGYPEETVKSVLVKIAWVTGIPLRELRVIYKGKQLQLDKTLEECGIENDCNLNVVGHLRSGLYPQASHTVEYVLYQLAHVWSNNTKRACVALNTVKALTTHYFNLPGFVEIFAASNAPAMLASVYHSPRGAGTGELAESCISNFLSCTCTKNSQSISIGAVMEFCKQLRKCGCERDDPLYVSCRNTLGLLLKTTGVSYGSGSVKQRVSLHDVFSFIPELADRLLISLDNSKRGGNTITRPSLGEVLDLTTFLAPLRNNVIMQQQLLGDFGSGDGKCRVEKDDDQMLSEEVDYLRLVFVRLLTKMDECFNCMAECLGGKEPGGRDFLLYPSWSEYLRILKELYDTSKLFNGAEEMFWAVLRFHKNMLSALVIGFVKRGGDHQWILRNRSVTNFECRRHLAMMLFPDVKEDFDMLHEILIDRSHVLAESFEYIGRAKPESLRSGLFMEFKNEEATGPGVLREWFVLVCRGIFDPRHALFVACPNDCRRFYPNPASKVHPQHLEYFRFAGRVIALALLKGVQVGIVFDRVFFMQLAGNRVTLEDIRDTDPYLYRSCKQILQMDADFIDSDALGLTFVREVEVLGCRKVVELCPGGKNLVMNSQNREQYVDLLIQHCFVKSISEQVSNFAKGFADILSSSKIQQFFQCLELEDLDWMLRGCENTISIDDWKAHTKYRGYKESDCQISWFWEIVGRMSAQQRRVLIFFWTAVKYLPVEGFSGLPSSLFICRTLEPSSQLPSSHTCFYQLCFPRYSSIAVMQDRFGVITQEHIACSFGTS